MHVAYGSNSDVHLIYSYYNMDVGKGFYQQPENRLYMVVS